MHLGNGIWRRAAGCLAAAGAVLLLAGGAPRAETPSALELEYKAYFGGMHALSFQARVGLGEADYRAQVRLGSDGLLAKLVDFSLDAEAAGVAGAGSLQPRRFNVSSQWRENTERLVEITYAEQGAASLRVEPPAEEDDRDEVPAALRRDTLDPISAVLNHVRRLARSGSCKGEVAVFDGRRRYDVITHDLGETVLEASDVAPYGGPAVRCGVTFRPIAGFWRSARAKRSDDAQVEVFLAPMTPSTPPVPVRIHAKSAFGALRIHLVAARPAARGLRVQD
ncbi:MAG: DUF3108 domain-containing protein [Rhodospirillales bacterium]|nr:DUF3108 domain-containing protein [Rhodospirillales bacterium]MDH3966887.1 DUF3108 domain-containing protein [Rhodospirillales bacterium]